MISDITIGQYYSGTSVIHRMDARMKFVLTMALIVILFVCRNFYSLAPDSFSSWQLSCFQKSR